MTAHAETQIRPFEPRDEAAVVTLWNKALWNDPVTPRRFEEMVLLDLNFDRRGCLVAEREDEVVGFLLAIARSASWWHYPLMEEVGWLPAVFVAQEHRRQGIGSALVERGLDHLRARGRREVQIDSYPPFFFLPGIDEQSYPAAVPFFASHGFQPQEPRVSMGISLQGWRMLESSSELEAHLETAGIRVLVFDRCWILPAMEFFARHFPAWTYYFHRKMAEPAGEDDIVIAVREEEVVGYCQQLEVEHIGPFGVIPDLQGRGVGTLMLRKLLARMQQKKLRYAWFGKAEPGSENFYLRTGFKVVREFTPMRLSLQP